MVGYSDRLDAYRVYVHGSKTIWVSECVKFLSKPPKARPLQPQDTEFQPNSDSESSSEEVTDQIVHSCTPSDNGDMAEDFPNPPVPSQQDSSEKSSDSDENQRSHPPPSKMRLRQSSERRPPPKIRRRNGRSYDPDFVCRRHEISIFKRMAQSHEIRTRQH